MSQTQPGRGLQLLLIGEAIAFVVSVVQLFGGSGGWLSLIALVLTLWALHQLRSIHKDYGAAFDWNIIAFVVAFAGVILALLAGIIPLLGGILLGLILVLMAVATTVIGYLEVRHICTATSDLCAGVGDTSTAALGDLLVKAYLLCMVVSAVCSVLTLIPLLGILFNLLGKLSSLATMAANGLLVYFLYRAMKHFA